jgi:hypothetical protein
MGELMPLIDFIIRDVDAMQARLRGKQERMREKTRSRMNEMLDLGHRRIFERLSGQDLNARSGALRDAFAIEHAQWRGNILRGAIYHTGGPSRPYGLTHELGHSGAYQIIAVAARMLHFFIRGEEFFRRHVRHPSIPAKQYVEKTADSLREPFKQCMQRAIDEAWEK